MMPYCTCRARRRTCHCSAHLTKTQHRQSRRRRWHLRQQPAIQAPFPPPTHVARNQVDWDILAETDRIFTQLVVFFYYIVVACWRSACFLSFLTQSNQVFFLHPVCIAFLSFHHHASLVWINTVFTVPCYSMERCCRRLTSVCPSVRLSVCPSVCDVGDSWPHTLR